MKIGDKVKVIESIGGLFNNIEGYIEAIKIYRNKTILSVRAKDYESELLFEESELELIDESKNNTNDNICIHCSDGIPVKSIKEDSRGGFSIEGNTIEVIADAHSDLGYDVFKINYCPMCGRKLI